MSALSVERACVDASDREALIVEGQSVTFGQLHSESLKHRRPLTQGTGPIALVAEPRLEHLSVLYACLEFQRPVLLIHARSSTESRRKLVKEIGAADVFTDGEWHAVDSSPSSHSEPGDAVLVPTSGTTGKPRIAVFHQNQLVAAARGSAQNLPMDAETRWALTLPYAHVGGLSVLVRSLVARACVPVLNVDLGKKEGWNEMGAHSVTDASIVPTQLARTLRSGASRPASLRRVLVGGAPACADLRQRAKSAGWPAVYTYGLTETFSQVATQHPDESVGDEVTVDCGRALPGVHLAVEEQTGIISVRTPTLMHRYWGQTRLGDGAWFRTGDRGAVDPTGRLVVQGRADLVIISGGENVSPETVEATLSTHSAVQSCVVMGVPDGDWGERVIALVQGDRDCESTLRSLAQTSLDPAARPKEYLWCPAIPSLDNGKLDRVAARAIAIEVLSAS